MQALLIKSEGVLETFRMTERGWRKKISRGSRGAKP